MGAYVYILKCANGLYYTGSTIDLYKRLYEHETGNGSNFTKKFLPFQLVYIESYSTINEAFQREKQIQGWSRRKKEALIDQNFESLIRYSRNYTEHRKSEE